MSPTFSPTFSLGPADHLRVAVTDVELHCSVWEMLGFDRVQARVGGEASEPDPQSIGPAEQFLAVASPASTRPGGGIRLVQLAAGFTRPDRWAAGPDAIDLYTRDLDRSTALAEQAGVRIGGGIELPLGPNTRMRQRMLLPGDDVHIVLVEITNRRPSVLDDDPSRLLSEVQSVMSPVASCDVSAEFWARMGLPKNGDVSLPVPGLDTMMHVPPGAVVRMTMHALETMSAIRLEFMEVVGATTPATFVSGAEFDARALLGRPVPVFVTPDPQEALAKAIEAGASVCDQSERWCAGGTRLRALLLAPDGVPFELHSPS